LVSSGQDGIQTRLLSQLAEFLDIGAAGKGLCG